MQLETWQRRTEWPLAALALIFLGAYAWPILDPGLDPTLVSACHVTTWVVWVAFAADYAVRLRLAPDRRAFVRGHLLDLAIIVLPVLRPLRLLRLVFLLEVLHRSTAGGLRGRIAVYVVGATSLVVLVAALAALDAERDADGALITTFGEALWWSFVTVTTVGYGDFYPVTAAGRLISLGLMVAGIALLGIVTASLASWLIEKVSDETSEDQAETQAEIAALAAEVRRLNELLGARAEGP